MDKVRRTVTMMNMVVVVWGVRGGEEWECARVYGALL